MGTAMTRARELAAQSAREREQPVGCVVERGGVRLGEGRNRARALNDPTAHAEIQALREACARAGSWQLPGAVVYTTREPCPMCLYALLIAHVERVEYEEVDGSGGAASLGLRLPSPHPGHSLVLVRP